jgi:WD40 repeat protein
MTLGSILLAVWVGSVAATVFNTPPTLGDRRVMLTWQPDADDPLYNGNTVLRVEPRITTIHGAGQAVRLIVSSSDGSTAYSVAEGGDGILGWLTDDGSVTVSLPLGPAGEPGAELPVALAMHASDRRILGVLPNGDLRLWRLDRPGPPETIVGQGGVRALLFYPGVRDTASLPYVSVGTDSTLRVWRRPGELLGPRYAIPVPGGTTGALDMTSDRKLVAVGTRDGMIRIYNVESPPDSPLLILGRDNDRHNGAVTSLTFTKGRRKLASVDTTGQVRIWRIPEGTLLATVETGAVAPFIAYSPPDGRILFVVMADGRLEMRNGDSGDIYRSEQVFQPAGVRVVTQSILTAEGVRTLVGDDDGGVTVIRAGTCRPGADQPTCFGGYMIWRSPSTNIEDRKLLRIYNYADSTWTFREAERAFSDPDSIIRRKNPPVRNEPPMEDFDIAGPPNGVPYFYSLTRFDLRYFEGGVFQVFPDGAQAVWNGFFRDRPGDPPTPLVAEAIPDSVAPLLGRVIVVPNPFEINKWEKEWLEPHVEFRNLPKAATIRIYTLGGDLVRVIEHGRGRYGDLRDASAWDFRNSSGNRVTSGVYVYQVVTPAGNHLPGEVTQGYFTVVF